MKFLLRNFSVLYFPEICKSRLIWPEICTCSVIQKKKVHATLGAVVG